MTGTESSKVFVSAIALAVVALLPHRSGIPPSPAGTRGLDERFWSSGPESLSGSAPVEDRRKATEALQDVLKSARERRDAAAEAQVSVRLGDLYQSLGLARAALPYYRIALEFSANQPTIRIEAQVGISRALLRLEDYRGGLSYADRALELSRALGDRNLELRALVTLGIAQYDMRDLARSLVTLQRAFELAGIRRDRKALAEAALNLGYNYGDLSDDGKAFDAFVSALDASRATGERGIEAMALVGLGHNYSKTGEKQLAMEHYHRAAPILEELDDPYKSAPFYTGMGYLYEELGDAAAAKDFYTRALNLSEKVGSYYSLAGNSIHLGRIQAAEQDPLSALRSFITALEHLQRLDAKLMESVVLSEIGKVQTSLGEEQKARENFTRALTLCRATGDERVEAEIQNDIGSIDLRSGRLADAQGRFQRALELSRKTDSPFTESRALFYQARVERATGRLDAALKRSEEALDRVDSLRTRIASHRLRASYVASVFEMHVFQVDLLMELQKERPGEDFEERGFLAAERAKARSLMEMLQETGPSNSSSDLDLVDYQERLEERLRKEAVLEHPETLRQLVTEIDRVRSLQKSGTGRRERFASAELLGVRELQRELPDERTVVLAYFLGDSASYLWAITSSSATVHRLPPREGLEPQLREIHRLLATRTSDDGRTAKERRRIDDEIHRKYRQTASAVSETLLAPAMGDLRGAERLVVVGDGILHQVSFSALPFPRVSSSEPLISRFEIVRLPSASTLRVLDERKARTVPTKKIAVLADPVLDARDPRLPPGKPRTAEGTSGASLAPVEPVDRVLAALRNDLSSGDGLSRLLSTRVEARRILDLVPQAERFEALGFDANRALVTSGELSQYEVVHFATHGLLDVELPELSGIVLSLFDSRGTKQDGFLRLQDLYELDLPVRLVVLSACSTGLGKDVRGEGLVGLVGGFLATGAQGVMASYWDVDDEATSELMKRFYEHLFAGGQTPSKALQLAQISMWKEERWLSPRFWAAFELQGDWR